MEGLKWKIAVVIMNVILWRNVVPLDFTPTSGGFIGMMKDEGFFRSLSIMINIMNNKEIKNKIKIMNKFFKENSDVFGCGIYYFMK